MHKTKIWLYKMIENNQILPIKVMNNIQICDHNWDIGVEMTSKNIALALIPILVFMISNVEIKSKG